MADGTLRVMGIDFAHPIGVAAGYDREGSRLAELAAAGFAFVEIGTLNAPTGAGAAAVLAPVVANVARYRSATASARCRAAIGVSIGSQRDAPDAAAAAEMAAGAQALAPLADFLVVNLSRPGSACRDGTTAARALHALLELLRARIDADSRTSSRRIPLLVKVAVTPDDAASLPEAAGLAVTLGYDGVVAAFEHWPSVASVCARIAALRARLGGRSLVAVGGVRTADTVRHYLRAGADLVEVYSAVAEAGPAIADTLLPPGGSGGARTRAP